MTSLKTTGTVDLSALDMSELIRAANGHHAKAESVAQQTSTLMASALDHALSAGAALAEVKARLNHGEWLPWLAANFEGEPRTAQRYLRLYDNYAELPNTTAPSHFGIEDALKLLAKPKPKPELKPRRETQPESDDAPAEVVERRAAPISQKPGCGVPDTNQLLHYVSTIHKLWPPGKSYRFLIVTLRQAVERLEKLEAQNGGEQ